MKNKHPWIKGIDGYSKLFQFGGFWEAVAFVNAVGWIAQRANHHPSITIDYDKVKLTYISEDMVPPCITERDEAAIIEVDALLAP